MADIVPTPSSLPPLPQSSIGAPGQHQYDNGQGNGQGNPAHMPPPPLPPVVIPQNTNPIPTAITSPMSGGMMSPGSAGGFVRRAAPEPNKRALYVGGLDPRVTEDVLRQIFETTGHVQNVKIIPDKNVGAVSINFYSVSPFDVEMPLRGSRTNLIYLALGYSNILRAHGSRCLCPHNQLLIQHCNSRSVRSVLIRLKFQSKGFNYGFIEYDDPGAAERAMQTLNGRRVHQAVTFSKSATFVKSVADKIHRRFA